MLCQLSMIYFLPLLSLAFPITSAAVQLRGVPLERLPFYRVNENFTCLDGSSTHLWSKVNDDYCDCVDGSDEPGTSACSNGQFYCENLNYKGKLLPSGFVDDGICDCCDGSDEIGLGLCNNTCLQMGLAAREVDELRRKKYEEGSSGYKKLIEEAEKYVKTTTESSNQLRAQMQQHRNELIHLEDILLQAESIENETLQSHEMMITQLREKHKEEQQVKRVHWWFDQLDENHDGTIHYSELFSHMEFDIDKDGKVSELEAREYLDGVEEVQWDEFHAKVWPLISSIVVMLPTTTTDTTTTTTASSSSSPSVADTLQSDSSNMMEKKIAETTTTTTASSSSDHSIENHFDEYEDGVEPSSSASGLFDEQHDQNLMDDSLHHDSSSTSSSTEAMSNGFNEDPFIPIPYSPETQKVVDAADEARKNVQVLKKKLQDDESEIARLETLINIDYGPSKVFFPMSYEKECFDFRQREYIYTLCPFDRATQKNRGGGGETSLGQWTRWEANYTEQLYQNGEACWNGPNRSTRVHIFCGADNELLHAEEPNRCEYRFNFATPAACSHPDARQYEDHPNGEVPGEL